LILIRNWNARMYLCLFNGLTDRDVRQAARSCNRRKPKDVYGYLGVNVECGSCLSEVRKVIATETLAPIPFLLAAE
jgi:bacterioferritin-associated ferredoxin